MKKLTIGVVGAGIYGNYHIHTYCCDKNVERVVFCDLNEERRIATADKYQITGYKTVKEMIAQEQLDAISIATPDPYHFEPAKDAMEAGIKYLFIEKPLATSVKECEELIALAEKHGIAGMANIILCGKLLKETGIIDIESVESALKKIIPASKETLVGLNLKALDIGMKI